MVAQVGSSVPACSATMYLAYQSGQFGSAAPGSAAGLYLTVTDIGAARADLVAEQAGTELPT